MISIIPYRPDLLSTRWLWQWFLPSLPLFHILGWNAFFSAFPGNEDFVIGGDLMCGLNWGWETLTSAALGDGLVAGCDLAVQVHEPAVSDWELGLD